MSDLIVRLSDFKLFWRVRRGEATPSEVKEAVNKIASLIGVHGLVIYLVMAVFWELQGRPPSTLGQDELLRLTYAFLPLSFLNFLFATFFERRYMTKDAFLRAREEMERKAESTGFEFHRRAILKQLQKPIYNSVFTWSTLIFALGEGVALYGIVLYFMGASFQIFMLFLLLAVAYFIFFSGHLDGYGRLIDELCECEKRKDASIREEKPAALGKTGIIGIGMILISLSSLAVWYFFFNFDLPSQIFIISVGPNIESDLKELCANVESELGIRCSFVGWINMPDGAYDSERKQFRADVLLEEVKKFNVIESTKVLGVTYVDLYYPGLNFVFGVAEKRGGAAVMSLIRLNPESYGEPQNNSLYMERATKVALKMLGHTFGFRTARSRGCVMAYSNSLQELDAKSMEFCGRNKRIIDEWKHEKM
jgi:archaemetzincin